MPTDRVTLRMDPAQWKRAGDALEAAGEVDRSAAVRLFFRWIEQDATAAVAAARAGAQPKQDA